MDISLFHIGLAAVCIILSIPVYRSLKAPFFLCFGAAAVLLACSSIAAWVPAVCPLSELSLALSGTLMAVAALQLAYVFRRAGDGHD